MEGMDPRLPTAADWSALIRSKCTLLILIHCRYGQEGSNWGEQCDPHARAQAAIAAVPAAAHLHVSVTSHWTDLNITCVAEYSVRTWAFIFHFYPRNEGTACNYMQMKAALIKHLQHGCWRKNISSLCLSLVHFPYFLLLIWACAAF